MSSREGSLLVRMTNVEKTQDEILKSAVKAADAAEETRRIVVKLQARLAIYAGIGSAVGVALLTAILRGVG